TQTPHTTFDEGALVTMRAFDPITHTSIDQREPSFLMTVEPGVKVSDAQAALRKLGLEATPPGPVPGVVHLSNVRSLPYLLAGFLVLLGIAAVGHALLTVSRRRVKELAVLRAVGLSPRQTAACVAWQAIIVALVALGIGIPLGVILGREVWQAGFPSLPPFFLRPLPPPPLPAAHPL